MIDSKFRSIVVCTDTPLPLSVIDVGIRKEPRDFHLTCGREDFELKKGLMCILTILSVDKAAVKVRDLTWCVQWRSQDIAVARAQHGHTKFVQTSVRSAEA